MHRVVESPELGVRYYFRMGVPQDGLQAHMWFNLTASKQQNGELREQVVAPRGRVAERMTPYQRAEAQRLARA